MGRSLTLLGWACVYAGLLAPALAFAQPPSELPPPTDRLSSVERRLEALERENAETKAENAAPPAEAGAPFPPGPGMFGHPGPAQQLPTPPVPGMAGDPPGMFGDPGLAQPYSTDAPPAVATPPVPGMFGDPGFARPYSTDAPPAVATEGQQSLIERLGTRYDNGFVLVESPDKARVPFELRFNLYNQVQYLNQQADSLTYRDHLGNVRPIDPRNDFSVNRNLFYFNGFVYDPKLIYNIIIWSSNSVASVVQGGYIGYEFNQRFKLYAGNWGIPGSRTLTRNFMFLRSFERSMADNFFRPGFTQGVFAEGEALDQVFYTVFVGNSLNTLGISTTKIDTNLAYSGSVWWEPLGDYGPPGAYRMAFSDFEFHESPVVRLGTSMTGAREDRFSSANAAQNNPENLALYNSDGVPFFATGSLAPGVTVNLANYYMWAQDYGLKYRGLAINGQHYLRLAERLRGGRTATGHQHVRLRVRGERGLLRLPEVARTLRTDVVRVRRVREFERVRLRDQLSPVEEPEPPGDRRGGPGAEHADRGDHHPLHGRHERLELRAPGPVVLLTTRPRPIPSRQCRKGHHPSGSLGRDGHVERDGDPLPAARVRVDPVRQPAREEDEQAGQWRDPNRMSEGIARGVHSSRGRPRVEKFETATERDRVVGIARIDVVHPRPGGLGVDVRGVVVARPTDAGPADGTQLPAKPIRASGGFDDSTHAIHDPGADFLHLRHRPVKQVVAGSPPADIALALTRVCLGCFENDLAEDRVDGLGPRVGKRPDRCREDELHALGRSYFGTADGASRSPSATLTRRAESADDGERDPRVSTVDAPPLEDRDQQRVRLRANPPSLVSLYFVLMSRPVWAMVAIVVSRSTRCRDAISLVAIMKAIQAFTAPKAHRSMQGTCT